MSKNITNKIVNCGFWLIISLAASVLLIWCSRRACKGYNLNHILALEAVVLIAFVLHIRIGTRNTQHATRNTQHATRNTQHAQYIRCSVFKQAQGRLWHSLWLYQAFCCICSRTYALYGYQRIFPVLRDKWEYACSSRQYTQGRIISCRSFPTG